MSRRICWIFSGGRGRFTLIFFEDAISLSRCCWREKKRNFLMARDSKMPWARLTRRSSRGRVMKAGSDIIRSSSEE